MGKASNEQAGSGRARRVSRHELLVALVRREALVRADPRAGFCEECRAPVFAKPMRKKPPRWCRNLCRQRFVYREHCAAIDARRSA